MRCPECGYELPKDSEFCQYCGAKYIANNAYEVETLPVDTASVENDIVSSIEDHTEPDVRQEDSNATDNANIFETGRKSASSNMKLAVILVSVLAVIFAGVNVYQYTKYTQQQDVLEQRNAEIVELQIINAEQKDAITTQNRKVENLEHQLNAQEKSIVSLSNELFALQDDYSDLISEYYYNYLRYQRG